MFLLGPLVCRWFDVFSPHIVGQAWPSHSHNKTDHLYASGLSEPSFITSHTGWVTYSLTKLLHTVFSPVWWHLFTNLISSKYAISLLITNNAFLHPALTECVKEYALLFVWDAVRRRAKKIQNNGNHARTHMHTHSFCSLPQVNMFPWKQSAEDWPSLEVLGLQWGRERESQRKKERQGVGEREKWWS